MKAQAVQKRKMVNSSKKTREIKLMKTDLLKQ